MYVPNTLCPMAFNNTTYRRDNSPCLGELCSWFDAESKMCAVAQFAKAKAAEAKTVVEDAPVEEKPKKAKSKANVEKG